MFSLLLRIGFARLLAVALQEVGHNAYKTGMLGNFIVFSNWTMFVKLLLSILLPRENSSSAELMEYTGMNSMIMSKSLEGKEKTKYYSAEVVGTIIFERQTRQRC